MKRSEMVEVLKNSFLKHSNLDTPYEKVADQVLADLENAGMIGPTIHWHDNGYGDLKEALNELDVNDFFQHEWEPENEV